MTASARTHSQIRGADSGLSAGLVLVLLVNGKTRLNPPAERVCAHRAGHAVALLGRIHEDESRDAADSEALLQSGLLVRVHLDRLQLAGQLDGHLLHGRRDDTAWPAPRCPEVDQDRDRAVLDHGLELLSAAVGQPRQRLAAFGAERNAAGGGPDSRFLSAAGAGDDLRFAHVFRSFRALSAQFRNHAYQPSRMTATPRGPRRRRPRCTSRPSTRLTPGSATGTSTWASWWLSRKRSELRGPDLRTAETPAGPSSTGLMAASVHTARRILPIAAGSGRVPM